MSERIKNLIYLFFPKRCPVCDEIISRHRDFCEKCDGTIEPINKKICIKCGSPSESCCCSQHVFHFRGAVAPYLNKDSAKHAIYNFKFGRNIDAADIFAKAIEEKVTEYFSYVPFDCVTSVPMHFSRRSQASYDHARVLAKAVAGNLGLPYKPLLVKYKQRKFQHDLSSVQRFENAKNCYRARDNSYENVLIIDDIKTTGATLDECSRALMIGGTENVYCATAVISACKDDRIKL